MYASTGMTEAQRDRIIYELRRRHTYARIAKEVGVSVGAVRASLARTQAALLGSEDWDRDLR
jgi:DNA-directed RNA polymerase specialized sigma24 family protein